MFIYAFQGWNLKPVVGKKTEGHGRCSDGTVVSSVRKYYRDLPRTTTMPA